jgi:hypothetical protein
MKFLCSIHYVKFLKQQSDYQLLNKDIVRWTLFVTATQFMPHYSKSRADWCGLVFGKYRVRIPIGTPATLPDFSRFSQSLPTNSGWHFFPSAPQFITHCSFNQRQCTVYTRCAPRIFHWGGADPEAIHNLCLILKIML